MDFNTKQGQRRRVYEWTEKIRRRLEMVWQEEIARRAWLSTSGMMTEQNREVVLFVDRQMNIDEVAVRKELTKSHMRSRVEICQRLIDFYNDECEAFSGRE